MTQHGLSIGLWREARKVKPWVASIVSNGDEVWAGSFDTMDEAMYAAERHYVEEEENQAMGDACGLCSGTGEAIHGGISGRGVCSQCHGTGEAPEEDE